jgi:hypothetical protein
MLAEQKRYMPAPFSYPYKFTKEGLTELANRLKQIPEVNKTSVVRKAFPNIPSERHYMYEPSELEEILIREEYLSFKLKKWKNIEFLRFPTFLTISFDYASQPFVPYKQIRTEWRERMNAFQKLATLRNTLDISRDKRRSSNVPVLIFVARGVHRSDFYNRDLNVNLGNQDSKMRFLKEVSLRSFTRTTDPNDLFISYCNEIVYEVRIPRTRYFYSSEPLFYNAIFASAARRSIDGPAGFLSRILRAALFVHVTLPSMTISSRNIGSSINSDLDTMHSERLSLIDELSNTRLQSLRSNLSRIESDLRGTIEPVLERIEEARKGYDAFLEDVQFPLAPPENERFKNFQVDRDLQCPELFEMARGGPDRVVGTTDRVKVTSVAHDIDWQHRQIVSDMERLNNQIASATISLESGNSILASGKNTKNAIRWGILGALAAAFLGTLLGPIVAKRFDRARVARIDKAIADVIEQQKQQTEIQKGLTADLGNTNRELERLRISIGVCSDKINQAAGELKEDKGNDARKKSE